MALSFFWCVENCRPWAMDITMSYYYWWNHARQRSSHGSNSFWETSNDTHVYGLEMLFGSYGIGDMDWKRWLGFMPNHVVSKTHIAITKLVPSVELEAPTWNYEESISDVATSIGSQWTQWYLIVTLCFASTTSAWMYMLEFVFLSEDWVRFFVFDETSVA